MSAMASRTPGSQLFAQSFVQEQNKEESKALRHWLLWGESTEYLWIPLKTASNTEKNFYLITSSWFHVWYTTYSLIFRKIHPFLQNLANRHGFPVETEKQKNYVSKGLNITPKYSTLLLENRPLRFFVMLLTDKQTYKPTDKDENNLRRTTEATIS